ncbi:hypothetical protein PM082_015954 [Marasmius tenuissimus]|nr:hypothetical protein PM082_015954 [Marasmius tenuissimus]
MSTLSDMTPLRTQVFLLTFILSKLQANKLSVPVCQTQEPVGEAVATATYDHIHYHCFMRRTLKPRKGEMPFKMHEINLNDQIAALLKSGCSGDTAVAVVSGDIDKDSFPIHVMVSQPKRTPASDSSDSTDFVRYANTLVELLQSSVLTRSSAAKQKLANHMYKQCFTTVMDHSRLFLTMYPRPGDLAVVEELDEELDLILVAPWWLPLTKRISKPMVELVK